MKISKTTFNMALKRGIEIVIEEGIGCNGETLVCFWDNRSESNGEWMFSYAMADNGSLYWYGNIYLPQEIKEELPATIQSEQTLREVVVFLSTQLHKVGL